MVADGVFAEGADGTVEFREATGLEPAALASLQEKVRRRVLRHLQRRGHLSADEASEMLAWEHAGGFSLDASVRVAASDRLGLERLCRYGARPAFASDRLRRENDDTLVYYPLKPGPDGRPYLVMTPLELLQKLAALIPPPYLHLVRHFGVFAPHSRLRAQVTATAGPDPMLADRLGRAAREMGLEEAGTLPRLVPGTSAGEKAGPPVLEATTPASPRKKRPASRAWAMLLARIYETLPLVCPRCQAAMKIIAFITHPDTVARILEYLGEPVRPPPLAPARGLPQAELAFA